MDYFRNKKQTHTHTHRQTMNYLLNINVTGDTLSQRKNSAGHCKRFIADVHWQIKSQRNAVSCML